MFKEILHAVESINQDIYEFFEEKYGETFPILELQTDGFGFVITFMGNYQLWSSENDERDFDEVKDEYEPFEPYLRRETQKMINKIGSIKIKGTK
ncbi:hypothetical protein LCGC14_1778760 [marine sediment metagenome]|uniref:Uncharacterized protein n=1 Tax=marine sediment metagenome TaxID=412755 RepID=A0A0F9GW61_9ZZZZ